MVGRRHGVVTIEDVARVLGISAGTVSRALNGRSGVNPETRRRVQEVAGRLGYQPNSLARNLLTGRSYTVGLITTDSFGRFSIPILIGAEDALGPGQMSVFLCDGREDPIRERHYVRTLLERRVDGIIVTGRRTDARPSIGNDLPVPVVYAMTTSRAESDLSITPDDKGGGHMAGRYLLSTGRRQIVHITGPERFEAVRQRAAGLQEALAESGVALSGRNILYGQWSEEWGRQAAHIALRADPNVDAIFCGSDQIARGVADALRESGIRVPEDIALIGFDNWDIMANACRPPLTTVEMNLRQVGRLAAEKLLEAINGVRTQGVLRTPCSLVLRQSTSPAGATTHAGSVAPAERDGRLLLGGRPDE